MKYISDIWKKFIKSRQINKTSTIRFMFPVVFGVFAILGASVISSESSYVRLEPSQTAVLEGERFSIDIYASAHVPVNAIDITIEFSPDKVEIVSVDKGLSVLNIWTQEPKVENNTITLGGGTYRRGFVGEHLVATIKAVAKFNGVTEFLVKDAELLAGDGKGTPVKVTGTGDESKTSFYIYDQSEDPASISAKLGISINADIDADGRVTLRDISSFLSAWRSQAVTYDFNSDGEMNFIDFSIILAKSFVDL